MTNHLTPHSDVINQHPSVLIIGYGWLGQQLHTKFFKEAHYHDQEKGSTLDNGKSYEFAFVCVPTPPNEDGSCNTSYVEAAIQEHKDRVKIFIIRSTVNVGFTDKINTQGIKAVFQPEHLGETINHTYAEGTDFLIFGGESNLTDRVAYLWSLVYNSNVKIMQTTAKTAELSKLVDNAFLTTKVLFCNTVYDIAKAAGISYNELREAWLLDERVGRSHTFVYENNRGVGGKCLPKDYDNLISLGKQIGLDVSHLEANVEYNRTLRAK